jgi:predicted permease
MKRLSPLIYSIRTLSREPLLSLTLVALLGFGIAASTTIFTVMDQVLFAPLPYRHPGRIVMLWETNPKFPEPAGSHIRVARDNFDAWRRDTRSFEAIEAYQQGSTNLTGLGNPEHLNVAKCTAGFFSMLGVQPKEGRAFLPQDGAEGQNQVVLLSSSFFRKHFQADPLGRVLLLNGAPYTIVGVLPREFHLPNIFQGLSEYKPDVWVPLPPILANDPPLTSKRRNLLVYARLEENVSISAALAELKSEGKHRAQDDPTLNSGYGISIYSLDFENTDPKLQRALYVLGLAVALVLLLISMNVSGLMFLRSKARQKDTAIMAALGARRQDLFVNAAAPALVLTALGALPGVAGAYAGIWLVVWLKPSDINAVERIAVNANSLIVAIIVFAVVLALIAFLPAWATGRINLSLVLKERAGASNATNRGGFQWSFLASAEIAIALLLTIGSLLLVRSVHRLLAVNPGFSSDHILTAHVSLPQPRYSNREEQLRFCSRILERLHSLPQVRQASLIDNMPLYAIHYAPFEIEGYQPLQPGDTPTADYAEVTPDFFATLSIHPQAGRLFTEADAQDNAAKVVIMNETLARALWPHEDPLGKRIRSASTGHGVWATVVGVIDDFIQFNVNTPARPELFWPVRQMSEMTIVLKTSVAPLALDNDLKHTIWQVDNTQPITDVQSMEEILRHSTSQARFNMEFLTVFASLGVFIALVGVYGLMSSLVTSRMREMGIRFALGAQARHVAFSLLRQMAPCVILGIIAGVGISFSFGKMMRNLLFGILPSDPLTYVVAPVAIFALMSMAAYIPLKKATQADPALILREG